MLTALITKQKVMPSAVLLFSSLALCTAATQVKSQAAAKLPDADDCAASGSLVPYCGLSHPEDLEVLTDGVEVLTSDMHITRGSTGITGQPGTLKALNLNTRAVTILYPSASSSPTRFDWGDPACPGEIGTALLPHGIHLSRRRDGTRQLLVVNHGARESVEFFELSGSAGHWSLSWRGCVVPPAPNRLNDVVALPDGGFLVTTMHRRDNAETRTEMERARKGENTGFLWRWGPRSGLSKQIGSDTPSPNGVQVNASGRHAFIATAGGGGDIRKLDLRTGKILGSVAVPNADNASWTKDGKLLVAGVASGSSSSPCFANPEAVCHSPSEIYLVNTAQMTAERFLSLPGTTFGSATVAVQSGSVMLVGSSFGDRILAVRGAFKR